VRIEPWRLGVAAFVLALFVVCVAIQHVTSPNGSLLFSLLMTPLFWVVVIAYPYCLVPRRTWKAVIILWVVFCAWPLAIGTAGTAAFCDPRAYPDATAIGITVSFLPVAVFGVVALSVALFAFLTLLGIGAHFAGRVLNKASVFLPVAFVASIPLVYRIAGIVWAAHGEHTGTYCTP
jgi:hypothetical protein